MDFTNNPIDKSKVYGGKNGNKIAILINNEPYMLKFPPINNIKGHEISYKNDCISEYISCHIYNALNIPAQDTLLGTFSMSNGTQKIVVACKDITEPNKKLVDFASLKNTIIDSEHNGYGTDLEDILNTIREQTRIDSSLLEERFWDMFVVDTLTGNFDRHNGNWGFLIDNNSKEWSLAPVYDCGSTLLSASSDKQKQLCLDNQQEMLKRIYEYPTSAIYYNDAKINMYRFLQEYDNPVLAKSLKKIVPLVNSELINPIIDKTPYISDISKTFYKDFLQKRNELILVPALSRIKKNELLNTVAPLKISLSKPKERGGLER